MRRSPIAPPRAKNPATVGTPAAALTWTDPAAARAWLTAVRETADDLVALSQEGIRRVNNRVLSRAERRRQTRAARRSMLSAPRRRFSAPR
jgi:hypothetical protein